MAEEVQLARELGVPMEGICIYPIIDRPDWDDPTHWHNSGLWDLQRVDSNRLERVLCQEYAGELRRARPSCRARYPAYFFLVSSSADRFRRLGRRPASSLSG